jgi:outer membrane cobalamin receptor
LPNKLKVMAAALALAATVQPAAAQAPNAQAEEIVVTAQRTGVPSGASTARRRRWC